MKNKVSDLGRSVSIIGVGYTPVGNVLDTPEIKDFTERELFALATMEAMEDAGVEAKDLDAFYIASVAPAYLSNQVAMTAVVADWIGMRNKPAFFHEEACSSTNVGLHHAVMAVASGAYDVVLSGGVNINLSQAPMGYPPHLREALPFPELFFKFNVLGLDGAYVYPGGGIFTTLDAAAITYAKKYGFSMDQMYEAMNKAIVISRNHALNNPKAAMVTETVQAEAEKFGFTNVDEYLGSKFNPLMGTVQRLKDVAATLDGASALIVCPTEMASQFNGHPVEVVGFGSATGVANHLVDLPWGIEKAAFEQAYKMANITDPYTEIDYMGIHDCSSHNYFLITEAAGYLKPGEGVQAVLDGRVAYDGDKPVNTSGGRLSLGHPVAGAGGIEIAEAVQQMRGHCGPRQMKKIPEVAAIQCYGGGFHANVSILRNHGG